MILLLWEDALGFATLAEWMLIALGSPQEGCVAKLRRLFLRILYLYTRVLTLTLVKTRRVSYCPMSRSLAMIGERARAMCWLVEAAQRLAAATGRARRPGNGQ